MIWHRESVRRTQTHEGEEGGERSESIKDAFTLKSMILYSASD
jgi:hypothetical protein